MYNVTSARETDPWLSFPKKLNSFSGEAAQHGRPLQTPHVSLINLQKCYLRPPSYSNIYSYMMRLHFNKLFVQHLQLLDAASL